MKFFSLFYLNSLKLKLLYSIIDNSVKDSNLKKMIKFGSFVALNIRLHSTIVFRYFYLFCLFDFVICEKFVKVYNK